MSWVGKENLQRTMILYFLLIMFASLLVGIEFILDIQKPELKETLLTNFTLYAQNKISLSEVFLPVEILRNKAVIMFVIIMCVMIIMFTMFINNITEPLQHMIEVSKKISEGDLTQNITIHSKNELAELGNVINEMSSNLQEITLLSKNVCSACNDVADRADAILREPQYNKESYRTFLQRSTLLKNDAEVLSEFIDCFEFYSIDHHDQ